MKYKQRIQKIPDATPLPGITVHVRRISDGSTIATLVSDADGWVELEGNGHEEPFQFIVSDYPGGTKYWRSDEVHGAGAISLAEIPHALRAFGDGVIRSYSSELAVSLVSGGPSVSVAAGAINAAGHPVVFYNATLLSNSRPASGTRIDRVVIRLNPEGSATTPGKAVLALLAGTVDAGVPALTQTADLHEVSLAKVTVPFAGAITLTDERAFTGEKLPVSGVVRADSASTTSAGGEALSGLSLDLVLPRSHSTYDIQVVLHGMQVAVSPEYTLLATYGSGPGALNDQFNTPAQVAIDQTNGWVYIADTANNRLIRRVLATGAFSAQITGLTGITGVCVDSSGNVYVAYSSHCDKYNSALVQQWHIAIAANSVKHIATDDTSVYLAQVQVAQHQIRKLLCSTGAAGTPSTWGGATGTGDGKFNQPWGIGFGGGEVYVVDQGNSRAQVFTPAGVYVRQFPIPANSRGLALDASGDVWVAAFGSDELRRYSNTGTLQVTIAQADADGIGVATGDILWVSNAGSHTLAKWDESVSGYGEVAIDIGGVLSDYVGGGNRVISVTNSAEGTAAGPITVTIRAFGKATSGQMSLASLVLSATATPRR